MLAAFGDVVLPRLGAATLQSVVLVVIVWALCRYMPRLSAASRSWLWWLVPLQLVIALAWPAPLGLPLLPAASDVAQMGESPVAGSTPGPHAQAGATDTPMSRAAPAALSAFVDALPGWPLMLLMLWLAGMAAMAAHTLRGYLAARRCLVRSRPCDRAWIRHAYRQVGAAFGLRRLPELRVSDAIDSPQLTGPLRPVILLPETQLAAMAREELDMILRHELTHWIRRDLWWGWLPAVAQHVFFFNPMAHVAAREYALAREAACDAAVLSGDRHAPQDYGRLLLRLGAAPRPCAGVANASPTFRLLKRRLTMLRHAASPSHVGTLALSMVVAMAAVMPYRIVARPVDAPMPAASATVPVPMRLAAPDPDRDAALAPQVVRVDVPVILDVYVQGQHRLDEEGAAQAQAGHRTGMQAEQRARRDAESEIQRMEAQIRREAEQAARYEAQARRDAEQAAGHEVQARRDAEEAVRHEVQAQRDVEQAARDEALARRDVEEAIRHEAQAQRDVEQAARDEALARRDAEEAARHEAQARRDAGQAMRDQAQAQRDAERTAGNLQARLGAERAAQGDAQARRAAEQARLGAERAAQGHAQALRGAEQAARGDANARLGAQRAEEGARRAGTGEPQDRQQGRRP